MQVPLGIILKNENKGSEMGDILSHLHQYVPLKEFTRQVYIPSLNDSVDCQTAAIHRILFGGDQLTAACACGALKAMSNAASPGNKQLSGLISVVEDWHVEVIILEVSR